MSVLLVMSISVPPNLGQMVRWSMVIRIISRWENLLECGRQSAFTVPEAGSRLHSESQILK